MAVHACALRRPAAAASTMRPTALRGAAAAPSAGAHGSRATQHVLWVCALGRPDRVRAAARRRRRRGGGRVPRPARALRGDGRPVPGRAHEALLPRGRARAPGGRRRAHQPARARAPPARPTARPPDRPPGRARGLRRPVAVAPMRAPRLPHGRCRVAASTKRCRGLHAVGAGQDPDARAARRAVLSIQATERMLRVRRAFVRLRAAAVIIQARARRPAPRGRAACERSPGRRP